MRRLIHDDEYRDDNVRNNKMVVMSNNNGCLWERGVDKCVQERK